MSFEIHGRCDGCNSSIDDYDTVYCADCYGKRAKAVFEKGAVDVDALWKSVLESLVRLRRYGTGNATVAGACAEKLEKLSLMVERGIVPDVESTSP